MKKAPKGKTGRGRRIRRWILVLLALLLVFAAVTLAWDPFRLIVREGTAAHKAEMLYYPAAVKLHHATRGGFLEHTLNIVSLGKAVAARYPQLDEELIVAGAILHDLGKLTELDTGKLGVASAYTAEGQLLGHINIGMAEVRAAAELLQVPEETAVLIEHMLLSHHGQPEFGSPKLPMFPEAEVLSTLDRLDAQLFEMFTALDGVVKGGFSERQWALDNRQLYQHGRK